MNVSKLITILLFCLFGFVKTEAKTIKLISIAFTEDNTGCAASLDLKNIIREGSKNSIQKLDQSIKSLSHSLGYNYEFYSITGNNFRKDKILQRLSNIPIHSDDIVFMNIISHGYNPENIVTEYPVIIAYTDPCTDICIINNSISFDELIDAFYKHKRPHILISIVDACNSEVKDLFVVEDTKIEEQLFEQDFGKIYLANENKALLTNIFDNKGIIKISSTTIGEEARLSKKGSVYTNYFADQIQVGLSKYSPSGIESLLSYLTDYEKVNANTKEPERHTPFYQYKLIQSIEREHVVNQENDSRDRDVIERTFNSATINEESRVRIAPSDFILKAKNHLVYNRIHDARRVLLDGLKKFPDNHDLKIGVFICEANLGFTKFTTMGNQGVCEIFNSMSKRDQKKLESPEFVYLQYALGVNFIDGSAGCEDNIKKAAYWLAISFNNGNKSGACNALNKIGVYGCFK